MTIIFSSFRVIIIRIWSSLRYYIISILNTFKLRIKLTWRVMYCIAHLRYLSNSFLRYPLCCLLPFVFFIFLILFNKVVDSRKVYSTINYFLLHLWVINRTCNKLMSWHLFAYWYEALFVWIFPFINNFKFSLVVVPILIDQIYISKKATGSFTDPFIWNPWSKYEYHTEQKLNTKNSS